MKFPTRIIFWFIIAVCLGTAVEWQKSIIRESNRAEVVSVLNELMTNGWPIDVWKAEKVDFYAFETVSLLPTSNPDRGSFFVSRRNLNNIKVGSRIINPKTREALGQVQSISPNRNPQHGLWEIQVRLTSEDIFKEDNFFPVWVQTSEISHKLAIPTESLIFEDNKTFVWTYKNDSPKRKQVEIGKSNPWSVEITSGLNEGEKVIVNGMVDVDRRPKTMIRSELETSQLFKSVSKL